MSQKGASETIDVVSNENVPENKAFSGKTKKIPPALKVVQTEAVGEKSPAPVSVYDLFKKYQKPEKSEKSSEKPSDMNVGFDQLTSDEKSGFLRKLQMLTVGNKKGSKEETTTPSFFKKIMPNRQKTTDFSSSSKKESSGEKEKQHHNRKKSARRLNFSDQQQQQSKDPDQKVIVAAMTKEYEKMATRKEKSPPKETTEKPVREISMFDELPHRKRQISRQGNQTNHSSIAEKHNAQWHGELPPRDYTSPVFSRKIFVGGVPWDITEAALKDSFGEFGTCAVEWPGQEARYRTGQSSATNPNLRSASKYSGQAATGYVYMIFEDERAVASLLHECSQEIGGAGEWYFKIRAQRSKSTEIRQVQIIPWVTSDSLFCENGALLETGIEPKRTVFVGALHGMMTAQVLHAIMEDCFGKVECVQLDTDKFKYPIGSGRVTFKEHGAYFKAIEIGYLHVNTSKFRKRVQIDPFLESTGCMVCSTEPAHCFCRNRNCFKYYCHQCWALDHGKDGQQEVHVPVIVPSSASKSYSGGGGGGGNPRRTHLMNNSPSKMMSHLNPHRILEQQQQNQQLAAAAVISPAFLVGAPTAQTLSALYGYIQSNQSVLLSPAVFDSSPITPSPSEIGQNTRKRSITDIAPSTVFFNSTPVMSPQKSVSASDAYYTNHNSTAAFLTPPPTYYSTSSTSHSSSAASPSTSTLSSHYAQQQQQQQQYYGTQNVYYGYMPYEEPHKCLHPQNFQ